MMDSIGRSIESGDEILPDVFDDALADAPGIEPPPMIGLDERRMHVRAYNFWAKLLDGRSFPSIESLDLDDLGDFGTNTVLLDFTGGLENPAIAFVGDSIAAECQLDESVQFIADVPRRSLLSRLTDHYLQIIANRAPIGFEAEFTNEKDATIMYRGVLLPFSSDDDTIDFILGVINWKQAAETDLTDALSEEMAAAALATPHARPTVPVWADGPEAIIEPDVVTAAFPEQAYDHAYQDDELVLDDTFVAAHLDGDDASLADWLANARTSADVAANAHARGHNALYQAIGQAWGFACAAQKAPSDYAELLDEAGIAPSDRSPMTPVVKLVFGAGYDKTRLAEYAAVLNHAAEEAILADQLTPYLIAQSDGIKGLVKKIRAAKNAARPAHDPMAGIAEKLRRAVPLAHVELPYVESEQEFSVLVARRMPDGSHAIIAMIGDDDGQCARTLKVAARRI
jgi:hypothetical protein